MLVCASPGGGAKAFALNIGSGGAILENLAKDGIQPDLVRAGCSARWGLTLARLLISYEHLAPGRPEPGARRCWLENFILITCLVWLAKRPLSNRGTPRSLNICVNIFIRCEHGGLGERS